MNVHNLLIVIIKKWLLGIYCNMLVLLLYFVTIIIIYFIPTYNTYMLFVCGELQQAIGTHDS
jgi:hypothetical protein